MDGRNVRVVAMWGEDPALSGEKVPAPPPGITNSILDICCSDATAAHEIVEPRTSQMCSDATAAHQIVEPRTSQMACSWAIDFAWSIDFARGHRYTVGPARHWSSHKAAPRSCTPRPCTRLPARLETQRAIQVR